MFDGKLFHKTPQDQAQQSLYQFVQIHITKMPSKIICISKHLHKDSHHVCSSGSTNFLILCSKEHVDDYYNIFHNVHIIFVITFFCIYDWVSLYVMFLHLFCSYKCI